MATYTFSRPCDTLGSWAPWPQRRRTCQWTQPYRWRTETVGLVRVGHCAGFFSNCCWQLVALRAPGLYGIACVKCLSCFQAFSPNIVRFVVPDYSIWHSSVWHWKICSWVCKQRDLASVEDAKTETNTQCQENCIVLPWKNTSRIKSSRHGSDPAYHPRSVCGTLSRVWFESRDPFWAASSRFFMSDVNGNARVASKRNKRLTLVFAVTVSTQGLILWMEAATWMLALLLARSSEFSRLAQTKDGREGWKEHHGRHVKDMSCQMQCETFEPMVRNLKRPTQFVTCRQTSRRPGFRRQCLESAKISLNTRNEMSTKVHPHGVAIVQGCRPPKK